MIAAAAVEYFPGTPEPALKSRIVAETGHLFASLPDTPASVQQLIASWQAEVQPDTSELTEDEKEALLKLQVEEVEDADTLVKLGDVLSKQPDRLQEAEAAYRKALDLKPQTKEAWRAFGKLLENKLQRHEEALDAFDHAIDLDPEYISAWNGKGASLHNLGRTEEAFNAYDHTLDIDPDFALAWYNKGVALGSLGRSEEALDDFERALNIDPDPGPALLGFIICRH